MNMPHRSLDRRSGLVLDTHELERRPGALKLVRTNVEAPEDLGIGVVGVPAGSLVELDLRLESVVEGVLVTGTATVAIQGECVRCLSTIIDSLEIDVQELFVYPGSEASEDEASRLDGDLIDLDPLLRDAVVRAAVPAAVFARLRGTVPGVRCEPERPARALPRRGPRSPVGRSVAV